MSETYNLFQQGRAHLAKGMAAQATVALEKASKERIASAILDEVVRLLDRP